MNALHIVRCLALSFLSASVLFGCNTVPKPSDEVLSQLAPDGTLRAAINFGNPVLAAKDAKTAEPSGVSIDLARLIAARLGVRLRFVPFESAGSVVKAARDNQWDIAFVALDPLRAKEMLQTSPYVAIEGAYLVPDASPLKSNDEVDRDGVRIAVGAGSAYDLFLSRTIKHAELVRANTSPEVTPLFLARHLEVAAGVKQQLLRDAAGTPGLRILPGSFMRIDQAMATRLGNDAGAAFLDQFIADMKKTGEIQRLLALHQLEGVAVSP
jgi:polar amino acid transport system substrate-binding protein